jgi:Mg-chelatase subunit ChlD
MRTKSYLLPLIPCVLTLIAGCHRGSLASRSEAQPAPAATSAPAASGMAATADPLVAPSPPASPAAAPASDVAELAATGGGARAARAPSKPMPAPSVGATPMPFVPFAPAAAASVKAGEWDDNANYREFQKYLTTSSSSFHRVDLRDRRFLVVRDSKGQGVPRCRVTVSDGQQKASTSFVTTASGRAIFFPHAEGFHEGKMFASADCADGKTTATFAVGPNDPDGLVDLRLQAERRPITTRTIDVAFVLDTTGSMSEEISAVKATIQTVANAMSNEQTHVRIGLVEYKDRGDTFVTKLYPFSSDLPSFSQKVSQIAAGGGGDTPEDMNAGLHAALTQLQWSDQSVARLAFVVGDAPPHLDYQDGPDYAADMKRASHRGIQLFTVAASGMDALGQVVFRQMAQFTGGTNMFVLRGGAGPQSTGGGDPASSCGGTHTNYSSGKLDALIVGKIRRELKALDADPMRIAGLKTDENAKPCNERVAFID